jgi:hypothetical protein
MRQVRADCAPRLNRTIGCRQMSRLVLTMMNALVRFSMILSDHNRLSLVLGRVNTHIEAAYGHQIVIHDGQTDLQETCATDVRRAVTSSTTISPRSVSSSSPRQVSIDWFSGCIALLSTTQSRHRVRRPHLNRSK